MGSGLCPGLVNREKTKHHQSGSRHRLRARHVPTEAQGHLRFGRQRCCSSHEHHVQFPAASKGDGQSSSSTCPAPPDSAGPAALCVCMCALHRYRHKLSCHMGKMQRKALLGAGECDISANKRRGDTRVQGGLRLCVRGTNLHEQEAHGGGGEV